MSSSGIQYNRYSKPCIENSFYLQKLPQAVLMGGMENGGIVEG